MKRWAAGGRGRHVRARFDSSLRLQVPKIAGTRRHALIRPGILLMVTLTAVLALPLQAAADQIKGTEADGSTALHHAVWADDLVRADELVKAGANVAAANVFG